LKPAPHGVLGHPRVNCMAAQLGRADAPETKNPNFWKFGLLKLAGWTGLEPAHSILSINNLIIVWPA
jgi:hypothetical protein